MDRAVASCVSASQRMPFEFRTCDPQRRGIGVAGIVVPGDDDKELVGPDVPAAQHRTMLCMSGHAVPCTMVEHQILTTCAREVNSCATGVPDDATVGARTAVQSQIAN